MDPPAPLVLLQDLHYSPATEQGIFLIAFCEGGIIQLISAELRYDTDYKLEMKQNLSYCSYLLAVF